RRQAVARAVALERREAPATSTLSRDHSGGSGASRLRRRYASLRPLGQRCSVPDSHDTVQACRRPGRCREKRRSCARLLSWIGTVKKTNAIRRLTVRLFEKHKGRARGEAPGPQRKITRRLAHARSALRSGSAAVRSCLTCYRMGTRASRKPTLWNRSVGAPPLRCAAWQSVPPSSQLAPRLTRIEPCSVSIHCHTLPCMSHSPSLFGGYEPTRVGRPRYFPRGALPNGRLPLKFACSEDR